MAIRTEDLEYHRPAGFAPLLARYYRPDGPGPFPAVLEVHGGAWTSGDRLNNVAIGQYLAARGIVVLSIDFRMPPAVRYPETVADVNFGIRFLKANAERFATRTDLVGGLGTSSAGTCCCSTRCARAIRATPRSRCPGSTPAWPSQSSAGRWPIHWPAITLCANAPMNGWWRPTINSGPPRRRWAKAIPS
jgi:BD-FAE protein